MHKVESITLNDLKEGSDEALKLVYEANRTKFLNFAKRYGLSEDELLDIYQDAYIAFYDNVMNDKITSFTSSISTYIISIAKYIIYDTLKKKKKTIHPDFDLSILGKKESLIENLEIETESLTKEQLLLQEYFATLGEKCQEILDLFYYRGFTIRDILQYTDYNSENVIKSTKSRCMKILKERIFNSKT